MWLRSLQMMWLLRERYCSFRNGGDEYLNVKQAKCRDQKALSALEDRARTGKLKGKTKQMQANKHNKQNAIGYLLT